jgi:hypothetical protein
MLHVQLKKESWLQERSIMSKLKDGGPAFPTVSREWKIEDGPLAGNSGFEYVDPGMTLRNYFAAKAMQGELAAFSATDNEPCGGLPRLISDEGLDSLARHWFRIADAMIRAGVVA